MPVNGLGWNITRQATPQDYQDAEQARAEEYARRNTAPTMPAPQQVAQVPLVTGNPNYKPPVFDAKALYGQPSAQQNAQTPTPGQGVTDWIKSLFSGQAAAQPAAQPAQAPAQQNKMGLLGSFTNSPQAAESVQQLFADTSKGLPSGRYVERMVATGPGTFAAMRLPADSAQPVASAINAEEPAAQPAQIPAPRPITIIRGGQKELVNPGFGVVPAASATSTAPASSTETQATDPYAAFNQVMQQMQQIIGGNYQGNFQQLPALAEMAKVSAARGQATEQATARKVPSAMDMIQADFYKLARQMLDQTLRNPNATPEQKAKAYQEFQAVGANLAGRQRFDPFATMYGAGGQ